MNVHYLSICIYFSEAILVSEISCLILLKSVLFAPNTSDRAQHVPNLKLKYSKMK